MSLKFSCPQGHTITCKEKLAGKAAKCPQCGVKFVVPPPGQDQADPVSASSQPSDSQVVNPEDFPDNIEFLCPNGHKLNGPSSLQGKPGQCPDCGAKFRIPTYEDFEEAEDDFDDDEILTGEVVEDDEDLEFFDLEQIEVVEPEPEPEVATFDQLDDIEEVELFPEESSSSPPSLPQPSIDAESDNTMLEEFEDLTPAPSSNGTHALAGIFSLFWQQRQNGGKLELLLEGGELLLPDRFCPELSQGTHAVFAIDGKDGTYTLTSVPWSAVLRVSLRKTPDLPVGLFEE